jgi:hypothetical protein
MESNERIESLKETIARAAAPAPLALADQDVTVYETYEPAWVEVPFQRPVRMLWDWRVFLQGATNRVKDMRLAIAGLVMSWASELSAHTIESLYATLGFDHVWSGFYALSTLQRNAVSEPARTFAHKAVQKDGQTFHIVCATFKGTTTIRDAITDIKSVKDGFFEAGRNCADSLAAYVRSIEGATDTNTILYITGHSLGAATANVVGRLTKDIADDDMRFVYTYASPNYECGGDENSGYRFPNFRTFTNADDAVPTVPPNFPKIGIEYTYDLKTLDEAQRHRFDAAYRYFRGVAFEADDDPVGLGVTRIADPALAEVLKNHLAATYMSFIVTELTDEQMQLQDE